jgi:hypothetical protein
MVLVPSTQESTQITICNYGKYAFDRRTNRRTIRRSRESKPLVSPKTSGAILRCAPPRKSSHSISGSKTAAIGIYRRTAMQSFVVSSVPDGPRAAPPGPDDPALQAWSQTTPIPVQVASGVPRNNFAPVE